MFSFYGRERHLACPGPRLVRLGGPCLQAHALDSNHPAMAAELARRDARKLCDSLAHRPNASAFLMHLEGPQSVPRDSVRTMTSPRCRALSERSNTSTDLIPKSGVLDSERRPRIVATLREPSSDLNWKSRVLSV